MVDEDDYNKSGLSWLLVGVDYIIESDKEKAQVHCG